MRNKRSFKLRDSGQCVQGMETYICAQGFIVGQDFILSHDTMATFDEYSRYHYNFGTIVLNIPSTIDWTKIQLAKSIFSIVGLFEHVI